MARRGIIGLDLEAGMTLSKLDRAQIFPERELPDAQALIAEGRKMAATVTVGRSPFLATYAVGSEVEYKRRCVAENRIMMHAQIGFRDADKSRRAFAEICEAIDKEGHRVDRYGICLDWSMGYPRAHRRTMQRGTGLILAELRGLDRDDQHGPGGAAFRRLRYRHARRVREHHRGPA